MQIKTIKISGFRGIPPVVPPSVDINLASQSGEIKDLILFGPNAYGKSSIADALEWFFKERVRGGTYYEEYSEQDNVHLKVGQPNYPGNAFIELEIDHNGNNYIVRKEIDATGQKINENLAGLDVEFERIKDEIIVLDHDQFRNFVASANDRKWATFASLIGFEDLDHFRAGIESLASRSITDHLQKTQLERDVTAKRQQLTSLLSQTFERYEIQGREINDLYVHFKTKFEVTLASLNYPVPNEGDILDEQYWDDIKKNVRASEAVIKASRRLGELQGILASLSLSDVDLPVEMDLLLKEMAVLEPQKEYFDKSLLFDFYRMGLQVIQENKSDADYCPLCLTPYSWKQLSSEVEKRNKQLDFEKIQKQHRNLQVRWAKIRQYLLNRQSDFASVEITVVKDAFSQIQELTLVDRGVSLEVFNLGDVTAWVNKAKHFLNILSENREVVKKEMEIVEKSLGENPEFGLQTTIDSLYELWKIVEDIKLKNQILTEISNKLDATNRTVEALRGLVSSFRSELSDFSGRVVEIINTDVKAYYDELHPKDDVRPFLDVSVSGNQRAVNLRCDYKGVPDKSAVSLLSESHRNSLGMSILLAFMKYKRQAGSPVGFCVFDDVTQSFDVEHRTNLINFLENRRFPEISDQQILFFTHDRTLADIVKRSGDQQERGNWLRVDIRHWWLERMLLESENDAEPLTRANNYINANDEIAAAIYARRGLEQIYKRIINKTQIRVPFSDKPWKIEMNDYRMYIIYEIKELWQDQKGFVDPNDPMFQQLFMSQRVLNLTVHDSEFLENPMTLGDVQAALALIQQLDDRFKCPNCKKYFHTLKKEQGNNPQCRSGNCQQLLT